MSVGRNVFALVSIATHVAYLTLAIDGKDVEAIALLSSIVIMIWGIILIKTYDCPQRTGINKALWGKAPLWPRTCVACYGFVGAILAFRAIGLS